jgi:FkbM family methyltransferase
MQGGFTDLVVKMLARRGVGIIRQRKRLDLESFETGGLIWELLEQVPEERILDFMRLIKASRSQLRQDMFVLITLDFKRDGYFVEFGATDGVELSNTYLLEKELGWTGILAEPSRAWHEKLHENRKSQIESRCVWKKSGETLTFHEADAGEFSAIKEYSQKGRNLNKPGRDYTVKTASLEEMLDQHNAPKEIDYLSIDTEGSEYEILSAFNFEKYRFRVITVEHNFQPQREQILRLLQKNGYERKLERISTIDDWYVKAQ